MKSAYLIKKSHLKDLEKAVSKISSVTIEQQPYGKKEHNLFIVTFSAEKNGIKDAHALSDVRTLIPDPKLAIFDEGNLYYARHLFDRLSMFEQKLRGVVRLRLVLDDESDSNLINELESQTFGDYCMIFFGDPNFPQQAKQVASNNKYFNEKQYLLKLISDIEFECLWDKHFNPDEMPTFREKHHDIRNYRNDVMHLHFISQAQYSKADALLKKACNELDAFIDGLLGNAPSDSASFASDLSDYLSTCYLFSSEFSDVGKALLTESLPSSTIAKLIDSANNLSTLEQLASTEAFDAAAQSTNPQSLLNEALRFYKTSSYFEGLSDAIAKAYNQGLRDAQRRDSTNNDSSEKRGDDDKLDDSDKSDSE